MRNSLRNAIPSPTPPSAHPSAYAASLFLALILTWFALGTMYFVMAIGSFHAVSAGSKSTYPVGGTTALLLAAVGFLVCLICLLTSTGVRRRARSAVIVAIILTAMHLLAPLTCLTLLSLSEHPPWSDPTAQVLAIFLLLITLYLLTLLLYLQRTLKSPPPPLTSP